MELSQKIIDALLHADSKALATTGRHGVNVVPVSTIRVEGGNILLMNYFLKKTLENVLEESRVALVCWRGLDGYQVKGSVAYVDSGEAFDESKIWVEKNVPDRTLLGLLVLTPSDVYNISPGAN